MIKLNKIVKEIVVKPTNPVERLKKQLVDAMYKECVEYYDGDWYKWDDEVQTNYHNQEISYYYYDIYQSLKELIGEKAWDFFMEEGPERVKKMLEEKGLNEIVVKPSTPFKFDIGDTVYNEYDEKGVVLYRAPNWKTLIDSFKNRSKESYPFHLTVDTYYDRDMGPHEWSAKEKANPFYIARFTVTHSDGETFEINKIASQETLRPPYPEELDEIKVKPSSSPVPSSVRNEIDTIIANQLPKVIQQQREDIGDPFTTVNDKGEHMLFDFVIDHMIASHHEILKGGQEMLVSHSNRNLVSEKDVLDYLEENPELKRYLDNLIWKYDMESIDVDAMKQAAYNRYLENINGLEWLPHPENWFLNHFKYDVESKNWLDDYVNFYDAPWDIEFLTYLHAALLRSDLP